MEFGNPIVGDEDLIRSAIKSPDFSSDPETGVQGWRIARDGSATFYNLVIGSENYTIDENGNAVFANVSADSITLDGETLQSLLNEKAEGPKSVVGLLGDTGGYNGSQLLIGRLIIPNFDGTREYAIGGSGVHFDKQSVTGFTRLTVRAFIAWDTPATTASQQLVEYQYLSDSASGSDWILSWYHPFGYGTPGGTDAHIAWFFTTNVSNALGLRCVGTDIGTPGARLFALDVGRNVNFNTFDMGSGTSVQQYVKTYSANGSASHQGDGTNRGVSECYQGQYSSTNGNQFSVITFPISTIQSDLSGSTINKVELYLNNNHWYFNDGGTAVIGTHPYTSPAGDSDYGDLNPDLDRHTFTYGQAKWVTLPNSIGNALRDNTAKGICLGKGPSTSKEYYGYFAGNGQSGEPKLRITYTK